MTNGRERNKKRKRSVKPGRKGTRRSGKPRGRKPKRNGKPLCLVASTSQSRTLEKPMKATTSLSTRRARRPAY